MAALPTSVVDYDDYIKQLNEQSTHMDNLTNRIADYEPRRTQAGINRLIPVADDAIDRFTSYKENITNRTVASAVDRHTDPVVLRARIISRLDDLINRYNIQKARISGWIIPGQPPAHANIIPGQAPQEGGIFRKWYPNYKMRAQSRSGRRGKRGSRRGKRGSRRR